MLIHDKLAFVFRLQNAWYNEHLRSYELGKTGNEQLVEQKDLADFYPSVVYTLAGRQLATLKHYICFSFKVSHMNTKVAILGH